MRRVILLLAAALLLTACVEIQPEIEVTPGDTPPEIEGARWRDLPVTYCVLNQPGQGFVSHEELVQLTQAAFAAWGVDSHLEGDCTGGAPERNGRNEVGWGNLSSDDASHQSGQTSLQYRIPAVQLFGGPEIVEADIILEADPPARSATAQCLYTTLLHEVGHLLGAQHIEPPAVMAAALSSCPQELTEADIAQITALYGNGS